MTTSTPKPQRHIFRAIVVLLLLMIGAMGLVGWWVLGQRIWTDDQTIRVAADDASLRQVLWTPPKTVGEGINTADQEYEPTLSPDGTELYFVRGLPGHGADIYISKRANNAWSAPQPLAAINTEADELGPRLSGDGNTLFFYSDRDGGLGGYDIWTSQRTADGWSAPTNLGPSINSPYNDYSPAPAADGSKLFFASNRNAASRNPQGNVWKATIRSDPSATDYDLWVALAEPRVAGVEAPNQVAGVEALRNPSKAADELEARGLNANDALQPPSAASEVAPEPARVAEQRGYIPAIEIALLTTPHHEGACCVSPAGDFLYFASNRPGGKGGFDLYRCRLRPAPVADPTQENSSESKPRSGIFAGIRFGEVENIRELNTAANETDPQLVLGGFRLYYSNDGPGSTGGYDLFTSDSREVLADRDSRALPALGWSWWILLGALLATLLLLFLLRDLNGQNLSTLQKCILASIFIHLLLTILFGSVLVTQEIIIAAAKQEGMTLTTDSDLSRQIEMTLAATQQQAELPAPANEVVPTDRLAAAPPPTPEVAELRELNLPRSQPSVTSAATMTVTNPAPLPAKLEVKPAQIEPQFAAAPPLSSITPLQPVRADAPQQPAPQQADAAQRQAAPPAPVQPATAANPAAAPTQQQDAPLASAIDPLRATAPAESAQAQPVATDPVQPAAQAKFDTARFKGVESQTPSETNAPATKKQQAASAATQPAEASAAAAPAQQRETPLASAVEPVRLPTRIEATRPEPAASPAAIQPQAQATFETQRVKGADIQSPRPDTTASPSAAKVQPATEAVMPLAVQQPRTEATAQTATPSLAVNEPTPAAQSRAAAAPPVTSTIDSVQPVQQAAINAPAKAIKVAGPTGVEVPANAPSAEPLATGAPIKAAAETDAASPAAAAASEPLASVAKVVHAKPATEIIETATILDTPQPKLDRAADALKKLKEESSDAPAAASAKSAPASERVAAAESVPDRPRVKEAGTPASQAASDSSASLAAATEARAAAKAQPLRADAAAAVPESPAPQVNAAIAGVGQLRTDEPAQQAAAKAGAAAEKVQSESGAASAKPIIVNAAAAATKAQDSSLAAAKLASISPSPAKAAAAAAMLPDTLASPLADSLPAAAPVERVAAKAEPMPAIQPREAAAAKPQAAAPLKVERPQDIDSFTGNPVAEPLAAALASPVSKVNPRAATGQAETLELASSAVPLAAPVGFSQFETPPALFQRSPEFREALLKKLGGTKESEDAVARALAYLARQQEPDGRWTMTTPGEKPGKRKRQPHDMALTALSVMAYLASDHTPLKEGPYRDIVARGIAYLKKRQFKNGDLRDDEGNMYDHAIATIALAEAAVMTGDPDTREAALLGVKFIVGAQDGKSGGWRYRPGEYGDTSVVGWMIMALHSAEQIGYQMPSEVRDGCNRWLDITTQKGTLLAGYQTGNPPRASMTSEALFCRILMGQTFEPAKLKGYRDYTFRSMDTKGDPDYYFIYYTSLSLSQMNDESWRQWDDMARKLLERKQLKGGGDDGAWIPVNRWDRTGGMIYTTCMATLTLEVYYRYLPMYGKLAPQK